MIVCHCRRIRDDDIHNAIDWMRASDPDTIITPGKVYRALGTTPDCGGCLPVFLDTMRVNPNLHVQVEIPVLRNKEEEKVIADEGRRESH